MWWYILIYQVIFHWNSQKQTLMVIVYIEIFSIIYQSVQKVYTMTIFSYLQKDNLVYIAHPDWVSWYKGDPNDS